MEEEENADYGGMVQPSQQHVVASCVKGISGDWHERFDNVGSVLNWHPGRGNTGDRHSPTL